MKPNVKTVALALLMATLVGAIVGLQPERASAIVRTAGVNVGDWAEYAFVTTGNSTIISSFFNLTHAKVTVTAISMSTNITSDVLETYANGTEKTVVNFVDLDKGYGNGSGVFIGASLVADEVIYPDADSTSEWYGAAINETLTKNYLGSDVSVNHFNRTQGFTSPEANSLVSLNYYWYQTTGMLAEVSLDFWLKTIISYEWVTVLGAITSMVPEFPTPLILPLFMAISTLAAVFTGRKIYRKRRIQSSN